MKLAVNSDTQEAVAVKIINLEKNPSASEAVRKEVSKIIDKERNQFTSYAIGNEVSKIINLEKNLLPVASEAVCKEVS